MCFRKPGYTARDVRRNSGPDFQAFTDRAAAAAGSRAPRRRRATKPDLGRLPGAGRPDPAPAARPDRRPRAALRLPPPGRAPLQPVADLEAPGDPAPSGS